MGDDATDLAEYNRALQEVQQMLVGRYSIPAVGAVASILLVEVIGLGNSSLEQARAGLARVHEDMQKKLEKDWQQLSQQRRALLETGKGLQ